MAIEFRDFTAGDVLTAVQMDELMAQATPIFTSTTTRDAALTAPVNGMFAYTTTTPANTLWKYNGTSWFQWDSEWRSFTPTWANLTIGDSSVAGLYKYTGGDMWINLSVVLGATASMGTSPNFTYPDSFIAGATQFGPLPWSRAVDASTGFGYNLATLQVTSTTLGFYYQPPGAAAAYLSATVPFTWAYGVGDTFGIVAFVNRALS
jgi:hypothetical protein